MENNILGRMNIFFIAISMDPERCSDYTFKKRKHTEKYGIVWSQFFEKKIGKVTLHMDKYMFLFFLSVHGENRRIHHVNTN